MSTFRVSVDLAALHAKLSGMVGAAEDSARPAAQAGAQVFYDEVKRRVPRSKKGHWFHGTSFKINGKKYWFDAGSLSAAVYQVFSNDKSGPGRATYHVAWNHKKAPYGFMVEFGTSRAPAHPFLRPAIAKAGEVEAAIRERYMAELRTRGAIA